MRVSLSHLHPSQKGTKKAGNPCSQREVLRKPYTNNQSKARIFYYASAHFTYRRCRKKFLRFPSAIRKVIRLLKYFGFIFYAIVSFIVLPYSQYLWNANIRKNSHTTVQQLKNIKKTHCRKPLTSQNPDAKSFLRKEQVFRFYSQLCTIHQNIICKLNDMLCATQSYRVIPQYYVRKQSCCCINGSQKYGIS